MHEAEAGTYADEWQTVGKWVGTYHSSCPLPSEAKEVAKVTLLLPTERDLIIRIVCEYFGLSRKKVLSNSKARIVSIPRQIIYYLFCKVTGATANNIGAALGKNHSTIVWGCNTVTGYAATDKKFAAVLAELEAKCREELK